MAPILIHSLWSCQSFSAQGPWLSARKILTNSDQRRRREGSVTLESGHLHKTSDICMTWSQAAGPRVWVIPEWPHLWHSLAAEPRLIRLCHKIAFLLGASRETRPNVMSGNSTIKTNGFQTVSIWWRQFIDVVLEFKEDYSEPQEEQFKLKVRSLFLWTETF